MGKKFMGLDGTSHFWDRAKAWILEQVTSAGIDKQSIIDAVYPVGSLYWSSKSTDPSTLFGGTWVQIKDRFVLACGDEYKTTGATGGSATVTLTVANLPAHTHSFTPAGSVSAHAHGLNNHTHSFSWTGSHAHNIRSKNDAGQFSHEVTSANGSYFKEGVGFIAVPSLFPNTSGFYTNTMTKCLTSNGNSSSVQIIQNTSITVSGTTKGNTDNTANATPTFTGTAGTTGSNGSGTSFSILPPYVVKYCWERTA